MHPWAHRCDIALTHSMRAARFLAIFGGSLMLICSFLIVIDVIARRLFQVSTWGVDELSYYAMAISSSWALAFALLAKAHIRIDIIRNQLGTAKRLAFDTIALCAMAFTAFMLSAAAWEIFLRSWRRGTTSITQLGVPLWIPQILWFAGFALLLFVSLLLLVRAAIALLAERSPSRAEEVIGVLTVEAESADAISDIAR